MPGGLNRTFPNVMTVEGVAGTEFTNMSSRRVDLVPYNVTFPFIRQAAGPCDLTARGDEERSLQYALQRCCQAGRRYALQSDRTVHHDVQRPGMPLRQSGQLQCLGGEPADDRIYLEVARRVGRNTGHRRSPRRDGRRRTPQRRDWYVGGICGAAPHTADVSLSFLPAGTYEMELMRDADDAATEPTHFIRETKTVTAASSFTAHMAPGGGFAARIIRQVNKMKMKNLLMTFVSCTVCLGCTVPGNPPESRIDDLLAQMTLTEKIAQMNQLSGHENPTGTLVQTSPLVDRIRRGEAGSVLNVTEQPPRANCSGLPWRRPGWAFR